MKQVIFTLFGITLLMACGQNKQTAVQSTESDAAEYALPLDSAIAYTMRYDSIIKATLNEEAPIKAYTVRAADIFEAIGMPLSDTAKAAYKHIRVYLGVDYNNNFRLLLTPVENASIIKGVAGNDVILAGPYFEGAKSAGLPLQTGKYVLDFTGPCPSSCPQNSPLMH